MTKEQFLKDFDDINFMYNNAMMKDSLERHIDDLLETELEKIKAEIHDMLKSDEVKNEYWGHLIYNKAHLFINIIDKHISKLKGSDDK